MSYLYAHCAVVNFVMLVKTTNDISSSFNFPFLPLLSTTTPPSLVTAAVMGVESIISLAWLWTVSGSFVKDAANTSDLTGPKITVTEEIEIPDDSGKEETIKTLAGRSGRKKRLIFNSKQATLDL